jgi:hypothetical protein
MLHLLKRHPLSVRAHFEFVLSVTYALPPDILSKFLPAGLRLDEWNGLGFLAAAFVQAHRLRPALFPKFAGRSYFFGGYRVFCRYITRDGRELRGLKIIRSDTDKGLMVAIGDLLTRYNYHPAKVELQRSSNCVGVRIASGDGFGDVDLSADIAHTDEFLPESSPFSSAHDARHFVGPMPYTFAEEPETNSMIRIHGIHKGWKPRLIPVSVKRLSFFEQELFAGAKPLLASCFYIQDVDYCWKRGVREPLATRPSRRATHERSHCACIEGRLAL